MKWIMVGFLAIGSWSVNAAEPLNGMQCGYYIQESQTESLGFVLSQVMDSLAVEMAQSVKEDGEQKKLHPTSQMAYLLHKYRTIILPAQEVTMEGFALRAQEKGSAIEFLKSLCNKPDTNLRDIMSPVFFKSIESVVEEINRNES